MAITINHSPAPSLFGTVAYQAGRGQALQREAARADEYAFRTQESMRQQQHAKDSMVMNAQLQQETMAQAQQNRLDTMASEYSMKDQFEKDQLEQKRSSYLQKKQMIEEAYNGGSGKINDNQYEIAMRTLQEQYAGRQGEIDITDPFYSKLTQADRPMWTAPDGSKIPLDPAEQAAWAKDREYKSRDAQTEAKKLGDQIKARSEQAKNRASMIVDLYALTKPSKDGLGTERLMTWDEAEQRALSAYPELPMVSQDAATGTGGAPGGIPGGPPSGAMPISPESAAEKLKPAAIEILNGTKQADPSQRIEAKKYLAKLAASGDEEARQALIQSIKAGMSK